ncbi:MAG: L-aspartate oxidase [Clostridiales bacterium]|nr:L-aspartate oxidase [Clostridiales bacterium]
MRRYLVDFDTAQMKKTYTDVLIIGSGIAGVYTALELGGDCDITIITKEEVEISNSVLAQGGIAVSLDKNDSPEEHMKDTLYAGAGLCDEESVNVLVHEAADNIKRVCAFGVQFDKSENNDKQLALTREGAHSRNRIIHAGDATGKEVCDKLIHSMMQRRNVRIEERTWALDLLVEDNTCYGVIAYHEKTGEYTAYYAGIVICASGGYGQLYYYTTNPEVATGDGAAMAYRAGGKLADLEFVQFHPTVLYHEKNKSFLISEAVRGEGAILRNSAGERFMPGYHELAELAPRDVVSRCIFKEMQKTGDSHVWLDITQKSREYLEKRFPTIFQTCLEYGIDISKDYIPIAPAEHYCMGGIRTGLYGDTSIARFYACGEAACNGIHGANRLASNSLLEGLVFGHRIGACADRLLHDDKIEAIKRMPDFASKGTETGRRTPEEAGLDPAAAVEGLRRTMSSLVGIVRTKEGLTEALEAAEKLAQKADCIKCTAPADFIAANDSMLACLVIRSALRREESRGAHYRADFPKPDDAWRRHIIVSKENETECLT